MSNIYTNLANNQLPNEAADTWTRLDGVKVTGDLIYMEAVRTVAAEDDADVIRICKLPENFVVVPHLCKIICEDPGTAYNISKIGDESVDGLAPTGDDDRYSGAINLSAGGAFDLAYSASAAGLAGYTTVKPMWLTATLGVVTSPTAGAKIRFVIVGAAKS
jgi:hypothetical protein